MVIAEDPPEVNGPADEEVRRKIKNQIRRGELPRYVFTKDPENDIRLERVSKPDTRYVGGKGPKKLTWGLKSTLFELTKK